ncbi:MAG: M43 family zinc metalloprotease [Bacteroidota bacterium]
MSRVSVYALYIIISLCTPTLLHGQFHRCGTDEAHFGHSGWQEKKVQIEQVLQNYLIQNKIEQRSKITIPVVVHIVWNQEIENISEDQILSQIAVLNQDFRAMNVENANVPAEFRAIVADTGIEFCLAREDERGRETNGIVRTFTRELGVASNDALIKDGRFGGSDAWDTQRFLNIWVGKRNDGILGEATMPGEAEDWEDGIVIDYRAFGSIGTALENIPYNLGRTLTHEVGHYLGLNHPWGSNFDNSSCEGDDGLSDTPIQAETYNQKCPNAPIRTCQSSDMYMNFMNYTDDACMSLFTIQQSERMLAVLNTLRKNLLENNICEMVNQVDHLLNENIVSIAPNPANDQVQIQLHDFHQALSAELYNALGQRISTFKIIPRTTYLLDVQAYSSGIYYLRLYNEYQHITKPILLNPK